MLTRLTSLALRAPRRTAAVWLVVLVLGVGAAGALFSTLDADLDGAPSFESEQVNDRLDRLAPGGGDVVAVIDGAPVGEDVLARLAATDGVEEVNTLRARSGGNCRPSAAVNIACSHVSAVAAPSDESRTTQLSAPSDCTRQRVESAASDSTLTRRDPAPVASGSPLMLNVSSRPVGA